MGVFHLIKGLHGSGGFTGDMICCGLPSCMQFAGSKKIA